MTERAGLIVFNNDTQETEGLWLALSQEGGNISWQPVARYWGVPWSVMGAALMCSGGIKQHYPGAEGRAITQALYDWAQQQRFLQQQQQQLLQQQQQQQAQAAGSRPGSAGRATAHSSSSNSRPDSAGASATANGGSRALPGVLGLLGRPGSAGSSSGQQQQQPPSQPAAAGAQGRPAAEPASAAAPAAGGGGGGGPNKRCVVCGLDPPCWLVMQSCRHLGPCLKCLPPPPGMKTKFLDSPAAYPECRVCSKPVKQVLRIVM